MTKNTPNTSPNARSEPPAGAELCARMSMAVSIVGLLICVSLRGRPGLVDFSRPIIPFQKGLTTCGMRVPAPPEYFLGYGDRGIRTTPVAGVLDDLPGHDIRRRIAVAGDTAEREGSVIPAY